VVVRDEQLVLGSGGEIPPGRLVRRVVVGEQSEERRCVDEDGYEP